MAKSLKDILAGVKSSKTEKMDLKDLQMSAANKDQADFVAKHEIEKHADRVGNEDDVYKGKTKKTDKYKFQKDGVYEESHCSDDDMGKKEKAGKKLLLDKKKVMDEGIRPMTRADSAYKDNPRRLSNVIPKSFKQPGTPSKAELRVTANKAMSSGKITKLPPGKAKGVKEEIEDVEEVVRIVDPIRKKLDPKHGQKDGSFQSKMERMHMAKAAKDRRKLTHGSGVSGFNSRLDPKLDKETYKKRDQDTGSIRAVRKEEVEYIDEVLTGKDPASKWIHDFVHSDNPKFKGKSTKERQQMALGAYYSKKRGGKTKNEQADTSVTMPGQASATTGGTDLDTVRV